MDKKKATGYDNIPPKILKVAAHELAFPITNLINLSVEASCFPSNLKKSELSPLFKAKDSLLSENYRPLSILPAVCKIFEKVFNQQLYDYFAHILSDILSAFRKKYGCQHVLTKLIEDSKRALDNHMHVGLSLLDLSKAFDCLPHRLLLCKLHAYGVSRDACSLLHSYLSSRFQRVKISASRSDWVQMTKGVPQGSILGPMLFNIFINDLIYAVNDVCPLYNYADDNILAFFHSDMEDKTWRRLKYSPWLVWRKSHANKHFQVSVYNSQTERPYFRRNILYIRKYTDTCFLCKATGC